MPVRPASADDHPSGRCCHWAKRLAARLLGGLLGCLEGLRSGWRVAAAAGDSEIDIATLADKATDEDMESIESAFMEGDSAAIGALVADVLAREEPTFTLDGRWLSMDNGDAIGVVKPTKGPCVCTGCARTRDSGLAGGSTSLHVRTSLPCIPSGLTACWTQSHQNVRSIAQSVRWTQTFTKQWFTWRHARSTSGLIRS